MVKKVLRLYHNRRSLSAINSKCNVFKEIYDMKNDNAAIDIERIGRIADEGIEVFTNLKEHADEMKVAYEMDRTPLNKTIMEMAQRNLFFGLRVLSDKILKKTILDNEKTEDKQ